MAAELPPLVRLPERLDRRLRLGPFPSARDALKFVTYAVVGAVTIPVAGILAWIPVLLAGFALSVWRPDGESIDGRLLAIARWRLRAGWQAVGVTRHAPGARTGRAFARIEGGGILAVIRTGGIPLAYLPPAELSRRFELYREALRTIGGSLRLLSVPAPIHVGSFLPAEPSPAGAEGVARSGYRELVEVIARRRTIRQAYVAVSSPSGDPDGVGRLETRVATLSERLTALGLHPTRLRDRLLREAIRRLGLREAEPLRAAS